MRDGSDGGRPSGSDSDSRFVCIDNNDNTVVEKNQFQNSVKNVLCKQCTSNSNIRYLLLLKMIVLPLAIL